MLISSLPVSDHSGAETGQLKKEESNYLENGLLVDGQHRGQSIDTALTSFVAHERCELHQTLRVRLQGLLQREEVKERFT